MRPSLPLPPVHIRLRSIFARALLLSAGGSLVACNEMADPPEPTGDAGDAAIAQTARDGGTPSDVGTKGFALPSCNAAEGVTTSPAADYLAVHSLTFGGPVPSDAPPALAEAGRTGTPCATAADRIACMAQLTPSGSADSYVAASWKSQYAAGALSGVLVTATRGGTVTLASDRATLLALLGGVDSTADAALVARLAGYTVGCTDPAQAGVRAEQDGFGLIATKTSDCPIETRRYTLHVGPDGTLTELTSKVVESTQVCVGRRPEGLVCRAPEHVGPALGAFFADIAHLEAAAVHAFEILARELEALGAPASLVTQARAAIADELRHAATTGHLARHFGGELRRAEVHARPLRDLYALALDNAVEGCVRETWGALFGAYQAQNAQDPIVRHVMATIAHDEARHAALSWQLHHWAFAQLSEAERSSIEAAQRAAIDALENEPGEDAAEVQAVAGTPSRAERARLLAVLRAELWSPAERAA